MLFLAILSYCTLNFVMLLDPKIFLDIVGYSTLHNFRLFLVVLVYIRKNIVFCNQ